MERETNKPYYNEEELIAKAKAGDEVAFMQLYNLYKGKILAYLYNYLGDYHKAEELCQDTFISCYNHLATYEPRGKFSSWLYKIATNLAKDELRRRKRQKEEVSLEAPIKRGEGRELTLGDVIPDESLRPDIEPQQKELEAHILGVINSLPAKYRDVLLLCDVQGLSYEEAAKILNCNVGTVGFRLHQARRIFRKRLKIGFEDLNLYFNILAPFFRLKESVNKMSCIIIKPILSYYIDGECSPSIARMLKRHLKVCPGCYAELVSLEESVIILGQLNSTLVPSEAFELAFDERLSKERILKKPLINLQDIITKIKEKTDILIPPVYVPRGIPVPVPVRSIVSILLILALSFSFYNTQIGYPPATILARGRISIYSPKTGKLTPLFKGIRLAKGDVIYVDTGILDIELKDNYKVRLKANTQLSVNKLTRSRIKGITDLSLDKGILLAKIKPDFKGSRLNITTPTGTAHVYGTEFMLIVPPEKDRTELLVKEGEVAFISRYGKDIPELVSSVLVSANHKIITKINQLPSLPAPLSEDEIHILKEVEEIGTLPKIPQPKQYLRPEDISKLNVTLALSMTPKRVRELFRPYSLAIEVTKGRETSVHLLLKEAIDLADQAEKENDKRKHLSAVSKLEEIVKTYPNPNYTPQVLVYIGSYYEQLSIHPEALKAFQEVIDKYPKSKWVSLAQCAIGIIYEEKLNNPAKAREAYQEVLENYPDSLEVTEARNGLLRLK